MVQKAVDMLRGLIRSQEQLTQGVIPNVDLKIEVSCEWREFFDFDFQISSYHVLPSFSTNFKFSRTIQNTTEIHAGGKEGAAAAALEQQQKNLTATPNPPPPPISLTSLSIPGSSKTQPGNGACIPTKRQPHSQPNP